MRGGGLLQAGGGDYGWIDRGYLFKEVFKDGEKKSIWVRRNFSLIMEEGYQQRPRQIVYTVAEDDPSLNRIERRGKKNSDLPRHHE